MNAITPSFPLEATEIDLISQGGRSYWDKRSQCETVSQTTAYIDMVNKTAVAVRQTMPLFEMKAALDTLNRILNPYPAEDLTTIDGLIAPMTASYLCIGGEFGQSNPGTLLKLSFCDTSDASQRWSYNRVTGQISNIVNPNVFIEMDGTTFGTDATIQTCATLQPAMDSPSGAAVEIDNIYQKWTYDTATHVLQNGSGLTLGWEPTPSFPSVTLGVNLVSNVYNPWDPGSGWIRSAERYIVLHGRDGYDVAERLAGVR